MSMEQLLTQALFYFFSGVMLSAATLVVAVRNPVHAMLWLIVCFFNAAGLFVMTGATFVAMILVIVYGGAVAVLFLFVVMMLDVNFYEMRRGYLKYLPLGIGIGALLLFEMTLVALAWQPSAVASSTPVQGLAVMDNTRALGGILYTDLMLPFLGSGVVLLIATVGAIVLTHRGRKDTRRQNVRAQLARRPEDVVELIKVDSGEGAL